MLWQIQWLLPSQTHPLGLFLAFILFYLLCLPNIFGILPRWKPFPFNENLSQLPRPVLQPRVQLLCRPPRPHFPPSYYALLCCSPSTPQHPCLWPSWFALQRSALQRTAILQWHSILRLHWLTQPCLQHPLLCLCRGGEGVDNCGDQLSTNVLPSIVGVY